MVVKSRLFFLEPPLCRLVIFERLRQLNKAHSGISSDIRRLRHCHNSVAQGTKRALGTKLQLHRRNDDGLTIGNRHIDPLVLIREALEPWRTLEEVECEAALIRMSGCGL